MNLANPFEFTHSPVSSFVQPKTLAGKTCLAICASILVAICAHISLPLPFNPVPLTLSDLAVLVIGLTLGARAGLSALLVYLLEGAAGLPVFTPGGLGGTAQLLGPTGGFLLSYPFVAALAGALSSRLSQFTSRFTAALLAAFCASILLFSLGAIWLAILLHLNASQVLHLAVFPFLYGNLVKIITASGISHIYTRGRRQS